MSGINSIKSKFSNPIGQSIVLLVACLFCQLFSLILFPSKITDVATGPWIIAGVFTLFYGFINATISLQGEEKIAYFSRSIWGYFIILIGSAGFAYSIDGFSVSGAGSIRWIFVIITFSYFVFLTIAFFMRKIISYAQRQDTEHQP